MCSIAESRCLLAAWWLFSYHQKTYQITRLMLLILRVLLSNELLCNEGVSVKLIPMYADAHNKKIDDAFVGLACEKS